MNSSARAVHVVGGAVAAPIRSALVRVAAERRLDPVAIDLAPWSGGSDVLLGLEHVPGVRWHDLDGADGDFDAAGLMRRLPKGPLGERVLAHDRWVAEPVSPQIVPTAVAALRRSSGVLIIDCDTPLASASVLAEGDAVWLVAAADVCSSAAGVVAAQWFSHRFIDHGTVLVRSGPVRKPAHDEFARIDRVVELGRADRRALEHGELCGRRGGLRRLAEHVLDELTVEVAA